MDKKEPLQVIVGADHGGFAYKQQLIEQLRAHGGYQVQDVGANHLDPADDYPVFARAVAEAVAANPGSRGLAICRSGHGMVMTANKVKGIRCILATDDIPWTVQSVEHDAANVLSIGIDYIPSDNLFQVITAWLEAEFQGGRHQRRIDLIDQLDQNIITIAQSSD